MGFSWANPSNRLQPRSPFTHRKKTEVHPRVQREASPTTPSHAALDALFARQQRRRSTSLARKLRNLLMAVGIILLLFTTLYFAASRLGNTL